MITRRLLFFMKQVTELVINKPNMPLHC